MRLRHLLIALIVAAAGLSGAGCAEEVVPSRASSTPSPAPRASSAPAPASPLPSPGARLPATATAIAAALADVRPRVRAAAAAWDGRGRVPDALALLALHEQRLTLRLAERPSLIGRALAALPRSARSAVRDDVGAQRALGRLSASWPVKRRHRTQRPAPAARLNGWYRAAHRRFGVPVTLLAAVNFVESGFGRQRNDSVAGAQGPMQFMPATWAAYGLGGDVQRPRDAIMGAANYLHANGSPRDDARALYRYNPSELYVDAVQRYERRMRTPAGFRAFYARSVFVRARGGGHRRITGPGMDRRR